MDHRIVFWCASADCNAYRYATQEGAPGQIVRPLISATKAEIELEIGQMEAHFLAGGNVGRVVDALISADRAAIDLPWQRHGD